MVFLKLLCLWLHTISSNPYQARCSTKRATSALQRAIHQRESIYSTYWSCKKFTKYITFGFTSFQLINPKRATARYSALSSKEKAYILLHTKVLLYIPDGFPSTTLPFTWNHFKSSLQSALSARYSALPARYPPKRKHIQYILKL